MARDRWLQLSGAARRERAEGTKNVSTFGCSGCAHGRADPRVAGRAGGRLKAVARSPSHPSRSSRSRRRSVSRRAAVVHGRARAVTSIHSKSPPPARTAGPRRSSRVIHLSAPATRSSASASRAYQTGRGPSPLAPGSCDGCAHGRAQYRPLRSLQGMRALPGHRRFAVCVLTAPADFFAGPVVRRPRSLPARIGGLCPPRLAALPRLQHAGRSE